MIVERERTLSNDKSELLVEYLIGPFARNSKRYLYIYPQASVCERILTRQVASGRAGVQQIKFPVARSIGADTRASYT
jgi:hypothetical protein